ncbi:DUF3823 domain-containing protein [Paracnuella aquatica]|uniref:DUF3823 domain-containing protein n=1 Tax=Paracnuella aquatica TaxID=2268757 RepID=UPI000DEFC3F8|nr:DUF3823 domain-containing protein [Paracnuella aquatica]RPD51321.1 DUF3823 domain-containing protein [Paracnuella aquatica]
MKRNIFYIIGCAAVLLFSSCEKDNYDAPASTLTGRVVYQDQPLGVRSDGVQLELWQSGYSLFTKIPVYVAQDGTFSASLFDGNYKLTRLRGNGPWADNTDTINIQVKGGTTVDVPVDPYFVIRNDNVQRSGNAINATFNIQRVNTTKDLEYVRLYVGQTMITDQVRNEGSATKMPADIADMSQPVTLSVNVPGSMASKEAVYARIGIKTVGVAELLYSQPVKINLK